MAASGYPQELARERRLFDGRTVTIRPIRPDDAEHVREFLETASPDARYKRFHKWVRAPTDTLIHFLTAIDYDSHLAFVCASPRDGGEEIVGEARYIANPDGRSCEFGVLIEDAWRKTGIAGLLMDALIRTARERGFSAMEGLVLRANRPMLRFARALGFEVLPMGEDPALLRIRLDLGPRARRAAPATAAPAADATTAGEPGA